MHVYTFQGTEIYISTYLFPQLCSFFFAKVTVNWYQPLRIWAWYQSDIYGRFHVYPWSLCIDVHIEQCIIHGCDHKAYSGFAPAENKLRGVLQRLGSLWTSVNHDFRAFVVYSKVYQGDHGYNLVPESMLPIIVGKWSFPAVWLLSIRQCRPWKLIWEQILRKPACTRSFPNLSPWASRSTGEVQQTQEGTAPNLFLISYALEWAFQATALTLQRC